MTELAQWAKDEQEYLWSDLDDAIRQALNGVWSMQAANVLIRLTRLVKIIGPADPKSVPWTMLAGGLYRIVLDLAGYEKLLPGLGDRLADMEPILVQAGLSDLETIRGQYTHTRLAILHPREIGWIRDEVA